MQKISLILLTITIFTLTLCSSGESPETSFEKFKQAACQGNIDEFISRVDFKSIALSNFKQDNPQAKDGDIKAYLESEKYNESVTKGTENFKKLISQKDNTICKFKLIETKTEGDVATLHVQEDPENPYYVFKHTYKKNGNKWVWTDASDLVNPPIDATSSELFKEFESNVVSAEQKFKDKPVAVKGTISKIGKDMANRVYITLGDGMLGETQCYIKESHIQKVATLKSGDVVIITGICNGKIMTPELKECVF